MRSSTAIALGAVLLSAAAIAQDRTLSLPHRLGPGEPAWLEVEVGPLPPGISITVTTPGGELLGRIAPFGRRPAAAGGTYALPVPAEAIVDGKLTVRLLVSQPGGAPRPANAQEVTGVRLR